MAGEEFSVTGGSKDKKALQAVMFMGGIYIAFDSMSTINSSPWTHETFSSPEKMASGKDYVRQSIIVSLGFGAVSSTIGGSPWPFLGVAAADAYLYWLYNRAFNRALSDTDTASNGISTGVSVLAETL